MVKVGRTVAKAFLKGVLWGSALSVGAVGIASVIGDVPSPAVASKQVSPTATSKEAVPAVAEPAAEAAQALALAPAQATPAKAPMSAAPAPDTLSAVPQDATRSAAVPEVGAVDALAATVKAPAELPTQTAVGTSVTAARTPAVTGVAAQALVTPADDPPVSVSTETAATPGPPEAPQVALAHDPVQPPTPQMVAQDQPFASAEPTTRQTLPELSISVDPAQPPLPEVVGQTTAFEPAQPQGTRTAAVDTPGAAVADAEPAVSDAPILAQVEAPAAFAPVADPVLQQPVLPVAGSQAPSRAVSIAVEQDPLQAAVSETELAAAVSENPEPPTAAPATPVLPETVDLDSAQVAPETGRQEPVAAPDTATPRAPLAPQTTQEIQAPEISTEAPDRAVALVPAARPSTLQGGGGVAIPGRPAGTLGNLTDGVRTNRLPTLATPAAEPAQGASDAPQEPGDGSALPVQRYAEAVNNPDGKPMMAIVLIDDGADLSAETTGLPALRSFPYPVSVAVDALMPDATVRMEAYRAAGFEVLAMVDLPEGATARDAEVTLEVALAAVPEAVGLLDGVRTGVQPTRAAADQVAGILAQTGHGFVSQNRGLNTTQKLAAREGVPSAVVFRDFDSAGQTSTVIRRFLDQAAFRAGQDGAVVMLGRLREDTVTALQLWAAQERAERVAMVPVSGVLTTEE